MELTLSTIRQQLDRGSLPPADVFFRDNVKKYRRFGHRARGRCPFHRSSSHGRSFSTPFSMELDNGLFHRFNCGAKGDIITFVQLRDGVDFITAAKKLGTLPSLDKHESARFRREAACRKAKRKRIETAVTKLDAMERELRQQYRARILFAERKRMRASARVAELGPDARGDEVEMLWAALQGATTWLERDLPAYTLLTFGAVSERLKFILHPDLRHQMTDAIRWRGFVVADDRHQIEVPR